MNIPKPGSVPGFKQYPLAIYTSSAPSPDSSFLFKFVINFFETDPNVYKPMFTGYIPKDPNPGGNPNDEYLTVQSEVPLLTGVWNHLAVVSFSQGDVCKLQIYQNGVLAATATSQYHRSCQLSTRLPQNLLIGKPMTGYGNPKDYFNGQIDDFRISNVVRYSENFMLPTDSYLSDINTLTLYNFENTQDDLSGNENPLTVQGNHFSFVPHFSPILPSPSPSVVPSPSPSPSILPSPSPSPTSSPVQICQPRPTCPSNKPNCRIIITDKMCSPVPRPTVIPSPKSSPSPRCIILLKRQLCW